MVDTGKEQAPADSPIISPSPASRPWLARRKAARHSDRLSVTRGPKGDFGLGDRGLEGILPRQRWASIGQDGLGPLCVDQTPAAMLGNHSPVFCVRGCRGKEGTTWGWSLTGHPLPNIHPLVDSRVESTRVASPRPLETGVPSSCLPPHAAATPPASVLGVGRSRHHRAGRRGKRLARARTTGTNRTIPAAASRQEGRPGRGTSHVLVPAMSLHLSISLPVSPSPFRPQILLWELIYCRT